MKKGIALFLSLACCLMTFSQAKKTQVALVIHMDTVFTVFAPFGTKTIHLNLSDALKNFFLATIDTSMFELKSEVMPEWMSPKEDLMGMPAKSDLNTWFTKLRKKNSYDLVVMVYRPLIGVAKYDFMNGFSYGMTTTDNWVFSLNDAKVWDLRDKEELAHVNLYAESEYVTRLDEKNRITKPIKEYTLRDIAPAAELINNMNREFVMRLCQNLWRAKEKFDKKK